MERIKEELTSLGLLKAAVIELEIEGANQRAFAVEVDSTNRYVLWKHFKSLVPKLGFYPVVTATWGGNSSSWEESIKNEEIFSRLPYSEEVSDEDSPCDVSPESIILRSENAAYGSIIEEHNHNYSEYVEEYAEEYIQDSVTSYIDELERRFGRSPSEQDILEQMYSGNIKDYFGLNKWIYNWSVEEVGIDRLSKASLFFDWYKPKDQYEALLLLPTSYCWEVIAYMHWFGACSTTTEKSMSLLKKWNSEYGAELVAHYGTMLHLTVNKKPDNSEHAFELAMEQESFAPCTTALSGASLSDLAVALMFRDKWFLHERP